MKYGGTLLIVDDMENQNIFTKQSWSKKSSWI